MTAEIVLLRSPREEGEGDVGEEKKRCTCIYMKGSYEGCYAKLRFQRDFY
jgi:hypothetical protein